MNFKAFVFGIIVLSMVVFVSAASIKTDKISVGSTSINASALVVGNASVDGTMFFNGSTKNVVFVWEHNDNLDPTSRTLTLRNDNETGWYYGAGYASLFNIHNTQRSDYASPSALQVWQECKDNDCTEAYGFWGGVTDAGDNAPNIGIAVGLQPYNTFYATNARSIDSVSAFFGTNEFSDAVSGTWAVGAGAMSIASGTPTYTNVVGLRAFDAESGRITNDYGVKIEAISKGRNNYGLYIGNVPSGLSNYSIYAGTGQWRAANLSGTGNAYVCVNSNGVLYRSSSACV